MNNALDDHRNRNVYLLLIILTCLITYFNSLSTGFLRLDDPLFLNYIKTTNFTFKGLFLPTTFDRYYRPFVGLSGMVNFYLFGYNSAAFHLTNVIIHIINSVLVFFLALEITGEVRRNEEIALLSSMIFVVHPLNSEAVIWISARAELFFCFFSLVFLFLLTKIKSQIKAIPLACLFMSYLCSLLSKESGIMLLPLAILFLITQRKSIAAKNSIVLITAMVVATACYFLMRNGMNATGDSVLEKMMSIGKPGQSVVMTNLAACGFYVGKMVYPLPLNIAITNIPVKINLIIFGITVPVMLYLYYKQESMHLPVLVILTGLLPPLVALNVQTSWTPYAERYMYAPMAIFSILTGFCLVNYFRKIPFIVLLSVVLFLSIPTIYRVAEWSDPVSFWQVTAVKTPDFAAVRLLFAAELMNVGRYDDAEKQLAMAKAIGFRRDKDRRAYEEFVDGLKQKRNRICSM